MKLPRLLCIILCLMGFSKNSTALDIFPDNSTGAKGAMIFGLMGHYQRTVFSSTNSSPIYTGPLYSAKFEYQLGDSGFSIGPIVTYKIGTQDNTANSSSQTEKLSHKVMTLGAQAYVDNLYFRLALAKYDLNSKASGSINNELALIGTGLEAHAGVAITLGTSFFIQLGADLGYVQYQPDGSNGISSTITHLNYGATLGVSFVIPSSSRRRTR